MLIIGFDSEFVFMLHTADDPHSRAKAIVIFGCTEELMNVMHAERKIIGQTENGLPFSLRQMIFLPMPNLSVIDI